MDAFVAANLYVFLAAQEALLDAVIWCLGPFVDDSRVYSVPRLLLAGATRAVLKPFVRRSRPVGRPAARR